MWFSLINGQVESKQFGLSGDRPICLAHLKRFETQPKVAPPTPPVAKKPVKKPAKRPTKKRPANRR